MAPSLRRLLPGLILLAGTIIVGTLGFLVFEGWSLIDSFYATVLIISTLGFGAIQPSVTATKLLTVVLIAGGVGTLYYLLGTMAQGLIETQAGIRKERRMKEEIKKLQRHVIVCGCGRVGQEVARELRRSGAPFVIVDRDAARVELLKEQHMLAYHGDASQDDVLRAVGVERARGMVICTQSDAVNVFITLSARSLNEKLYIVARSTAEEDEPKLLRAGANRAITPASLGGRRLAGMIMRPAVLEFLDVLVHSDELEMWLEELSVNQHQELLGQTLGEARLRDRIGVTILAVKRADGRIIPNPPSSTRLDAGDILIALGTRESLLMLGGINSIPLPPLAALSGGSDAEPA